MTEIESIGIAGMPLDPRDVPISTTGLKQSRIRSDRAQKRGIAGTMRFSRQPSVKRNIPAEILLLSALSPRWNFIRETLYVYAGN